MATPKTTVVEYDFDNWDQETEDAALVALNDVKYIIVEQDFVGRFADGTIVRIPLRLNLALVDELQAKHDSQIDQFKALVQTFGGDLARTIGEVVSNADGVAGSARHLSTSAHEVSASTESQSASTATAASAVEEMTVSIDHIGASAAEASQQAVDAGSLAAQSEHDVDAAATQIDEVANQVERTAQQMQMLSEQLEQIGSISVVIREVADQTNLLALNAAIEAARAGSGLPSASSAGSP